MQECVLLEMDTDSVIVSKCKLTQSKLFQSLIECITDNSNNITNIITIPFPAGYQDIFYNYIAYINNIHIDSLCLELQTWHTLKRCFELSHLLQDFEYLQFLVNLYYEHYYNEDCCLIGNLHPHLQWDIYLRLHYQCIPFTYGRNYHFNVEWLSVNKNKTFIVDDHQYYHTVEYHDTNVLLNDINNNNKSNNLKEICTFVDKNVDGIKRTWHDNNMICEETYYCHGQQHGLETRWYRTGQMLCQGVFQYGNEDGLHTCFYKDGKTCYEYVYTEGKKHGYHKMWYDTGIMSFYELYYHDLKHGQCRSWNEYGVLIYDSIYHYGVPQ